MLGASCGLKRSVVDPDGMGFDILGPKCIPVTVTLLSPTCRSLTGLLLYQRLSFGEVLLAMFKVCVTRLQ
jgi:hypothetical protein